MKGEVLVGAEGDLKDGDVRIVTAGTVDIGVIRHNGRYYAYRNYCPHQGGPACEGVKLPQVVDRYGEDQKWLGQCFDENDMHIVCPWHGYEFHLDTGINVADARLRLQRYDVITRDGNVYVAL